MRSIVTCVVVAVGLLAVFVGRPATAQVEIDIRIEVDPRVELLGIVFRLAGNPEYNQPRVPGYAAAVDEHFGPHREHAAVQMARQLRQTRGISFDAVMGLAIHLTDGFAPAPARPLDQDLALYADERWSADHAARFIDALVAFARDTEFRAFFDANAKTYDQITARMNTLITEHMHPQWFSEFFGVAPTAPFSVIPALLHGGANYGPKFVDADGNEHLYAIIGIWVVDDAGEGDVDPRMLSTVVHEFNHSFVNHVVAMHRDELKTAGEIMFPQVAREMRRQAYGNWETMFNESLVRAAVVRYVHAHDGEEAARQRIHEQETQRSFLWTGSVASLLAMYERQRDQYPTFESFMPRIVEFFNGYAPNMEAMILARAQAAERNRPNVVSITPDLRDARDVDPATSQFVITFDRPMGKGYSFMRRPDAEGVFPEITNLTWSKDNTVLTVDVTLQPETRYAFALNASRGGAFQSRDGNVPLREMVVTFTTAGDD